MRKIANVFPLEENTIAAVSLFSFFLLHLKNLISDPCGVGVVRVSQGFFLPSFFCTITMLILHYSTCIVCSCPPPAWISVFLQ